MVGQLILPYDCGCDDEVRHLSFWTAIVDENLVAQQPGESEKLKWWSYEDIISLHVSNDILAGMAIFSIMFT